MRKLMLITLFSFFLVFATSALAVDFGIRGGLNYSSLPSSKEIALPGQGFVNSSISALDNSYTGFHFGVYTRFRFASVFLQPELLYTETGQRMLFQRINVDNPGPHSTHDVLTNSFTARFSHLEFPLTAGLKFGALKVGAGPVFSLLLDNTRANLDFDETLDTVRFHYNESTIGYQLMAGFQMGTISLDFMYRGNLSGFGDSVQIGGESFDFHTKPHQYIISLGIKIF